MFKIGDRVKVGKKSHHTFHHGDIGYVTNVTQINWNDKEKTNSINWEVPKEFLWRIYVNINGTNYTYYSYELEYPRSEKIKHLLK